MALVKIEDIINKCKRVRSGCLEWQGTRSKDGYGIIQHAGSQWYVHRLMWRLTRGHPGKLFILHKCDNPSCCDPQHLSIGTAKDNAIDASQKKRSRGMKQTHCKRGHEYTPENTLWHKTKPGKLSNGRRFCKTCHRERCRINMKKYALARQALKEQGDESAN